MFIGNFVNKYTFNRKKNKYINYVLELKNSFKIKLLDASELNLLYKNLKRIKTWRTGEYEVEDITTERHFIFTKFIQNADGKEVYRDKDNKLIVVFNEVSEILDKKIQEAST